MNNDNEHHRVLMAAMLLFSLAMMAAGMLCEDIRGLPERLIKIYTAPAPLVTDYTVVGGLSGALFNSGSMGLCTYLLYKATRFRASGGALGAYFMSVGLGFFGKTPLTLAPFVLGGYLYALCKNEPYSRIVQYPIQAAALSPVVSVLAFDGGFSAGGAAVGIGFAILTGFIITPVAQHTKTMHRGFDLYNVGLAAGLIGIIFYSIYKTAVPEAEPVSLYPQGESHGLFFSLLFVGLLGAVTVAGYMLSGRSFQPFLRLRAHTGINIDFAPEYGAGAVLVNLGLVGLMMLCYMLLIGAPMNGATAGALICVLCWTGNGANTRNVLPVLVGYWIYSIITENSLSTQALCIAVCYGTGLAPVSGVYGGIFGIIAGMLHAFVAGSVISLHGGFNLYNGGFSAGLTAMVLLPVLHNLVGREYTDNAAEKHPGLVVELAGDAVKLAEGAAHLIEGSGEIVHEPPESHRESKTQHTFLSIRNLLVLIAGVLFLLSAVQLEPVHSYTNSLKFAAYIIGAGAYGAEVIVLTNGMRHNPGLKEMFMPYMFGVLYVLLGFSYLLSSH